MPEYSQQSLERLNTCHPKLQALFKEAIKHWNITIVTGRRGRKAQNELYEKGRTQLKYPNSKHNAKPYSLAVDAVPYFPARDPHIPWNDKHTLLLFAGRIDGLATARGIDLRIGVDWDGDNIPVCNDPDEDFFDGAHFELRNEKNINYPGENK